MNTVRPLAFTGSVRAGGGRPDQPDPEHTPVMLDRVTDLLAGAPDGVIVDCTVGAGGHAQGIAAARGAHADNAVLGLDRDPQAVAHARIRLADSPGDVELVHGAFDELDALLDRRGIARIAGVLYDLGMSSLQLDRPRRGFSYRHDGPLDMRMDPQGGTDAADLVNDSDEDHLAAILTEYGDERFAARIAAEIVAARPLRRTGELAAVVREAIPAAARRSGGHPATRTFQALRIAVNDELGQLRRSLPRALERLMPGGIAVVLAYHSLEDRIVHGVFGEAATDCVCPPDLPVCGCGRTALIELLTSRPERPSEDEIRDNPRARSVHLRAARRRDTAPDRDGAGDRGSPDGSHDATSRRQDPA